MAQQKRGRTRGFTLVELLVVISIIGMLVGLLVPAVQMALRRARCTVCQNNMRNITTILLGYETAHGQYPGYLNVLTMTNGKPYVDPQTGKRKGVSFIVPILTGLDRPDLYKVMKTPPGAGADGNNSNSAGVINTKVKLDNLIRPEDPPTLAGGAPTSYVVNAGMQDTTGSATMPRDWPENGVFFDLYTGDPRVTNAAGGGANNDPGYQMVQMSNAFISHADGLQNTMLMTENVDAGEWTDTTEAKLGVVWNATGTVNLNSNPPNLSPPDDSMRINTGIGMSELEGGIVQTNPDNSTASSSKRYAFARPSSFHPGGVNMAFCDGRVMLVSDQIDYYVYCLLMSTNGERVRMPGSYKVLPNFGRPLNDTWLQR